MKRHSNGRVNIQINPGDDFEKKLTEFLRRSQTILKHPKNKPLKIKKSLDKLLK